MFGSINNIPAIVESVEVECVKVLRVYKKCENAEQLALLFSAVLSADKGIPNEVVKIRKGWRVVDDRGMAADFWQA
jgi:hypothetical protein